MIRLGFAARLFIIFVTSLVALQLLVVLAFFLQRSRDTDSGLRMPLPDQAAALVELLEACPRSSGRSPARHQQHGPARAHIREAARGPRGRLVRGAGGGADPAPLSRGPRRARGARARRAVLGAVLRADADIGLGLARRRGDRGRAQERAKRWWWRPAASCTSPCSGFRRASGQGPCLATHHEHGDDRHRKAQDPRGSRIAITGAIMRTRRADYTTVQRGTHEYPERSARADCAVREVGCEGAGILGEIAAG